MKIRFIKEFDITDSANEVIDLINDSTGDEVIQEVILQVEDDADVAISGAVLGGENEVAISAIAQGDLSVVSSISSSGIYIVPVEGLTSISLAVTGSSRIIVKAIG